jgi:hypothetical protein
MHLKCPRCGSTHVSVDRTSLPQGTAYEFHCFSCGLWEDAIGDHEAIARLRERWGELPSAKEDER